MFAFITSTNVPSRFKFSINVSPEEKGFLETGLKVESFIRIDKIATTLLIQKEVSEKLKYLFNL